MAKKRTPARNSAQWAAATFASGGGAIRDRSPIPLTPIALLLTAVLAEGLACWLRRDEWMLLVRFLVVLGALSAVPASPLGWLADFPTVYRFHQILGTTAAAWSLVCATLVCIAECEEGSPARRRFRGALLFGAFLIGAVGFLGGALGAGGLDHYKFWDTECPAHRVPFAIFPAV